MATLESLFDHVTIAKRITDSLSDVDLRRMSDDPYWSMLDILPSSYWSKRAQRQHCRSKLGTRLIPQVPLSSAEDYCDFLCLIDSIKRCETKYKLKSFFTQQLDNGPGTEPVIRGRTSLSPTEIVWSSSTNGSIIMDTESDTVRILSSAHLNIRFFGDFIVGWENNAELGQVFISLYSAATLEEMDSIKSDAALEQIFLTPSDRGDVLVLTTHTVPDEGNMTTLEVNTVEILENEFVLKRQLKNEVPVSSFLVSYSMFENEIFCLAAQNDINRRELAVFNPQRGGFQHIDFEGVISKTHLQSDILKDEGFTCWSPIQMESADVPVFIVAFGCKMRFRSFYSGIPIFRHCRSACFARFKDESRTKLEFYYLPVQMHFDLFIHDGFVQILDFKKKNTFGSFYKFVQSDLFPKFEVCEIPIQEDLNEFYPKDSSKVGFSISGISTDDSILLTIRTWPSRSAADISVKHRIAHIKFLPDAGDETDCTTSVGYSSQEE